MSERDANVWPCCPECSSLTKNGCGAKWHDTAPERVCSHHGWPSCPLCGSDPHVHCDGDPTECSVQALQGHADALAEQLERISLAYIEATNPGIDMEEVRRGRASRN